MLFVKVFGIPKSFLQKGFWWGMGQHPSFPQLQVFFSTYLMPLFAKVFEDSQGTFCKKFLEWGMGQRPIKTYHEKTDPDGSRSGRQDYSHPSIAG